MVDDLHLQEEPGDGSVGVLNAEALVAIACATASSALSSTLTACAPGGGILCHAALRLSLILKGMARPRSAGQADVRGNDCTPSLPRDPHDDRTAPCSLSISRVRASMVCQVIDLAGRSCSSEVDFSACGPPAVS